MCTAIGNGDAQGVKALIDGGAPVTAEAFAVCAFKTQSGFDIRKNIMEILLECLCADPTSYSSFHNYHRKHGLNSMSLTESGYLSPLHVAVLCRGDSDTSA